MEAERNFLKKLLSVFCKLNKSKVIFLERNLQPPPPLFLKHIK